MDKKLTKSLTNYQESVLKEIISADLNVKQVRNKAAQFLIEEGYSEKDVLSKIIEIPSRPMSVISAKSVWCIMFPWFCK